MKETIDWPTFALKLKQMRQAVGFTQKQLAKHSKVGEKTLSSFESGKRTNAISFAQLMDLTWACGYTVSEFLERNAHDFGPSLVRPARGIAKTAQQRRQRRYREERKQSMSYVAAVPIIRPKRGITIFRSSDFLQSSLGESRR